MILNDFESMTLTDDNAKDVCDWINRNRAKSPVPVLDYGYDSSGRVTIRKQWGAMTAEIGDLITFDAENGFDMWAKK